PPHRSQLLPPLGHPPVMHFSNAVDATPAPRSHRRSRRVRRPSHQARRTQPLDQRGHRHLPKSPLSDGSARSEEHTSELPSPSPPPFPYTPLFRSPPPRSQLLPPLGHPPVMHFSNAVDATPAPRSHRRSRRVRRPSHQARRTQPLDQRGHRHLPKSPLSDGSA